ncbi:MAG: hypothetical protein ACRC92_20550 [Peptostreptococcaceae bacterium]
MELFKGHKKVQRGYAELTMEMPESFITTGLCDPVQDKISSQRKDLSISQKQSMVLPLEVDLPYFDSSLSQEIMSYSSCISMVDRVLGYTKEIRSPYGKDKITLLSKHQYQLRTIYIYKINNRVFVYDDNHKTVVSQRFVSNMHTDLDLLEPGDTVMVNSEANDRFHIKYPSFYNPNTELMGYGRNILTINTVTIENAQDSISVDPGFVDKFLVRKAKYVNIDLSSKRMISRYANIFPPIGEIVTGDQFLCKLVSSEGDMFTLAQSSDIPAGEEDDTIILEKNSFMVSVEVFCNNTIDNPILEKYRQDLLAFRKEVYLALEEYSKMGYELDNYAKVIKENYSYTKFRNNFNVIDYPLIKLRIDNISKPTKGSKFSNRFGGKITVQRVYPRGSVKDEYGRNIEAIYTTTGVTNRLIPGMLLELYYTSLIDHCKMGLKNGSLSLSVIRNFLKHLFDKIKLSKEYSKIHELSDAEFEWILTNLQAPIPITDLPVSNGLTHRAGAEILVMARKEVGYKRSLVYDGGLPVASRENPEGKRFCVGYMYMIRLVQDPEYMTSVIGTPEKDSRGLYKDDDESKKKGTSDIKMKPSKVCTQSNNWKCNKIPDHIQLLDGSSSDKTMTVVNEHALAIGMRLGFVDDHEEDID